MVKTALSKYGQQGLYANGEQRNEVLSLCVVARAYASGASAPDTGSAERGGRVLPAAGLAHFFCPNGALEKARAGSNERMKWNDCEMNEKGLCVRC